jgi:hypothetical protein
MIGIVKGKKDNSRRKFPASRGPRPDLAKIKKDEALARKETYDKLSIEAKILDLNERLDKLRILGKEPGAAKKQLAKLMAQLEKRSAPIEAKETKIEEPVKKHSRAKDRRAEDK